MIIYMENNEKEKKEKTGWVAELISWVQVLVSAAVIAFVLTTFVIANSEIPTGSMENTIMAGSRVIGDVYKRQLTHRSTNRTSQSR